MKVHGVAFHKPFPLGGANQPNPQGRGKEKGQAKGDTEPRKLGLFSPCPSYKTQPASGDREDRSESIPGDRGLGPLPNRLMRCGVSQDPAAHLCQAEQLSKARCPLSGSDVSPCLLSLPPHLTLRVPPRRAGQLSSLPKRLLPGFKSQSKLHLNNTEQISSTAFPPHEYFIRLLGAKPVGGGIKLTARTHGC